MAGRDPLSELNYTFPSTEWLYIINKYFNIFSVDPTLAYED